MIIDGFSKYSDAKLGGPYMLFAMTRAAVIFVLLCGINAFGQTQDAKPFEGCYSLTMSEWRPKLRERVVPPPSKIQLTLVATRDGTGYVVLAAAGAAPSAYPWTGWKVLSGKKVRIFWSTGYVGLEMNLERAGWGVLKGNAQTFFDYTNRRETSFVTATPISCELPLVMLVMDKQSR